MVVLVVGAWHAPCYQQGFANALSALGHNVHGFSWWDEFFDGHDIPLQYKSFYAHVQYRTIFGPQILRVQNKLFSKVAELRPEIILFYAAKYITARTIACIKASFPRTLLVSYNNDDPFGPSADFLMWRHFRRSVPLFDINFVYRNRNIDDIRNAAGKNGHILRSYYIPEDDYRVTLAPDDCGFGSDVVFVGHYENDSRLEKLLAIAESGVRLTVFGTGWERVERRLSNTALAAQFPIRSLVVPEYRKAISGAKIVLNFLSKLNRDTYTRRCFQIPAMKSFLLSEYSDDLASLFEQGKEIEFFYSTDTLLEKIKYYLKHDMEREAIALGGNQRVVRDGHDVLSRVREFMQVVERHIR